MTPRSVVLVLDLHAPATLAAADLERLQAEGVLFTTLAAEQAAGAPWLEKLCSLDNATRAGDPAVPRSEIEFEHRLAALGVHPPWCFVARIGDQYVGYSVLDVAKGDGREMAQSWTGVRPEHRRRGIATALKELGRRQAAAVGYTHMRTTLRHDNAPAIALNRKLGYRPVAESPETLVPSDLS